VQQKFGKVRGCVSENGRMDLCQVYPSCCWEWADRTALFGSAYTSVPDNVADQMMTMSIPDAEILAVLLLTVCFNVFDWWHKRLWFKRWGVPGDRVGVVGWKLSNRIPRGHFLFTCSYIFAV